MQGKHLALVFLAKKLWGTSVKDDSHQAYTAVLRPFFHTDEAKKDGTAWWKGLDEYLTNFTLSKKIPKNGLSRFAERERLVATDNAKYTDVPSAVRRKNARTAINEEFTGWFEEVEAEADMSFEAAQV